MYLYAEATIKIVEKNNFSDQEGKTVEYFTVFLKNEEGEVIEVNTTTDFTSKEGVKGVAKIRATKREGGGHKLSLKEFTEGMEIAEGIEEI